MSLRVAETHRKLDAARGHVTGGRSEATLVSPGELNAAHVADPWRRLAEARSNPFLTPEWMQAWLASHPQEKPFAIAWRLDGELRGVLPLVAVRIGPTKLLRLAGARRADWMGLACYPEDEGAMAEACVRLLDHERHRWQAIRLDRLDEESAWPQVLRTLPRSPLCAAPPLRRDVLPFIRFDERGFDGYLADRSRNFRSQLGRRRRRLERDHGLRFRMTESLATLDHDLGIFFHLHDARWQRRGGSSSASPAVREHQRRFAASALARGWLRLWIAEADGVPAAAWYGWRIGERYCYALAGFAEAYEDKAIGTVLLSHTIERAADEGASVYDLMWGDECYKRRFETGRRQTTTWVYGRGRIFGLGVGSGVGLAKAARSLPPGLRQPLARLVREARA
jgi:CelD/BcsL family acetyltransferase involved in cellulose biosynthesis